MSTLCVCHGLTSEYVTIVFRYQTFVEKKSTFFLVRTILTKFYIMPYNSVILASKEIDCMA